MGGVRIYGMLTLVTFFAAVIHAEQETYQVKLNRPHKVGESFTLQIQYSRIDNLKIVHGTRQLREDKSSSLFDFSAKTTVTNVDNQGRIAGLSAEVIDFKVTFDGGKEDVLPKNSKIKAMAVGAQKDFTVDGKTPEDRVAEVLDSILPIAAGGPTDDEIFGTPEKKTVGESWPINPAKLAEDMQDPGMTINKDNIQGTSTLSEVNKEGGYMNVTAKAVVKDIPVPFPYGHTQRSGTGTLQFSGRYPLEQSEMPAERKTYLKVEGVGVYKNPVAEKEMTANVVMEFTKEWKFLRFENTK
jgi:hypothetical protein